MRNLTFVRLSLAAVAAICIVAMTSNVFAVEPYYVDLRTNIPSVQNGGIGAGEPRFEQTGFHGPTGGCSAQFENCAVYNDLVQVGNEHPNAVAVLGFAFQEFGGDGTVDITTIYGADLNAGFEDLVAGGFDTVQPLMTFSNEKFIGINNEYDGVSLGTIGLGDLSSTFPDFDLSSFDGAVANDPNDIVYAFRTNVVLADVATIPEPASMALLCGGLLAMVGMRRQRRC